LVKHCRHILLGSLFLPIYVHKVLQQFKQATYLSIWQTRIIEKKRGRETNSFQVNIPKLKHDFHYNGEIANAEYIG
jgi:hypothetical protein